MPSILVATGFVRIDSDTKPAMKALQALGSIGGNALATAIAPAAAAATTAVMSLASAASAAGGAFAVYGAAVKQQFSQVTEAMQQQKTAQDAQTKATNATAIAQQLAREGGFKYGQQVKITADMTEAARLRAQNYNSALSTATSSTKAATQAQDLYKTKLGAMPKATSTLTEALQKLKDDTQAWSDSMAGSTMPVFTRGVEFLDRLLPKLSPIVRGVAHEIDGFVGTLGEGTAGKVFREFGKNVSKSGAGALRTFLDIARNLTVGIVGILNAFMPMSAGVSGGLEKLTEKFATFGANLGGSSGFARFTDMAKDAGPRLVELFRVLGEAFLKVASAAGPMSGVGLTLITIFAKLVDAIPTPVLQLLVPVILAVNTGMKLYTLYQSAATAATWLFSTAQGASRVQLAYQNTLLVIYWVRLKLIAAWQKIAAAATLIWQLATTAQGRALAGQIIMLGLQKVGMVISAAATGILTAATWALNAAIAVLTSPIGLVVIAIGLLVAAFVIAWKHSETFRNIVKGALGAVKDVAVAVGNWFAGPFVDFFTKTVPGAFRFLLDWVKTNWPWLIGALGGPVGLAVVYIIKHWDKVKASLKAGWDFIHKWVVQPWVNIFTQTVPDAARSLRDRVIGAWDRMKTGLKAAWDFIYKWVIAGNIRFYTQTIPGAARSLKDRVVGAWNTLRDGLVGAYGSIRNRVFSPIGNFFTKTIPGWASTMSDQVKGFFRSMRDGIGTIWNGIKDKAKTPINWVIDHVWNHGIRSIWGTITGWIGIKNTLGKIKLLASGGTVGNSGMGIFNRPTAIVGEGNPSHPEYVIPTDPKYRARALNLWRAAGTHFYAGGGIIGSIGDWLGSAASTVSSVVKGAADFFTDPVGKAKKMLLGSMKGIASLGHSPWVKLIASLPGKAVDGLVKAVKNLGSDLLGSIGLGDSGGSGVQRWSGIVQMMLRQVGQPPGLLGITLKRMNQESGGNPNIVNKWDSNWKRGTPSVGLMQVIGPTFQHYAGRYRKTGPFLYGVSVNPAANIYASMKYALAAYGSLASAYGRAGGYRLGTMGSTAGWHWLGEDGPELAKLPAGTRIRSNRASVRQAAASPAVIHLTVENHGVIGSRHEVENWLVATLERLRTQRRLPRSLGGTA